MFFQKEPTPREQHIDDLRGDIIDAKQALDIAEKDAISASNWVESRKLALQELVDELEGLTHKEHDDN